jgi:hypothetical protein
MLFKRKGRYYVIYGSCCCACREGSGAVRKTPFRRANFYLNTIILPRQARDKHMCRRSCEKQEVHFLTVF